MPFYVPLGHRGFFLRVGAMITALMGGVIYWRASRRRSILPLKDFRTYGRLVRLLREFKPAVVHTHSSKAGILGRWAADNAKVPAIVHTVHGLGYVLRRPQP